MKALKQCFELESIKELYTAELNRQKKLKSEDWAAFGEDLKTSEEKAYPDLQVEAQDRLALNQYLAQIGDPQLVIPHSTSCLVDRQDYQWTWCLHQATGLALI